jgi:C-terminal processing protease CtpA/Prc
MHLTLTGERVNDEWLRIVRRAENLTSLELKRVDVSDDGLNSVTELSNLQYLRLLYSPITDTSLGPLSKLKQAGAGGALTTLQLYGTRITPDASKRLAKELEGDKVDYRKGGFLGIGGDPFNNAGCLVGRVEPNTAAARAGIQQGDIILSYAGRKVEDFEGLTQMIAENEPGDRVTLEILRGEAPLTADVTLGLFQ